MKKPFYNPVNLCDFSLGITQVDKEFPFKSTAGVFLENAKVLVYRSNSLLKTYTVGSGLTLAGSNVAGQEKTMTLSFNGSDFARYAGDTLNVKCTFFNDGDIEIIFNLKIV
jgi:hypothetical protein